MLGNRSKIHVLDDFDKITDYDSNRDMYYFHRRLKRLFCELPKNKNARILDFGGGSGLFSLKLKERGYSSTYLVDLSPVQVKQAKEKGLKNVVCGDEDLVIRRFSNKPVDFMFMADVIEHLENPVTTLLKLHHALISGGKLFITYPNPLWVPLLNVLGNIGLKLKGKDNKIYIRQIANQLKGSFVVERYEGHMLVSKLPPVFLTLFEAIEELLPQYIRRRMCILNVAILRKI